MAFWRAIHRGMASYLWRARRKGADTTAVGGSPQAAALVLALFACTSLVESAGVSQILAFVPLQLRSMGMPAADVPRWVGILSALVFVLGLPIVPLWGVWADKYSRKAVIIRSALVEALVFGLIALSSEPWHLAGSFLLVGFQLGNTGVMLAMLRDVTPKHRLGATIALFGASSPLGFALGPALGGFLVDGLGASLSVMFALSAALSLGVALLLAVGLREVRPERPPEGRIRDLAYGALRGVLSDVATRRLFMLFGIALLAQQMARPFLPLLVERVHLAESGLASAIALVVGTASMAGALVSPVAGALGDRVGFRVMLGSALAGAGVALAAMPAAPSVLWLALIVVAFAASSAAVQAMIFGLLAIEVPPERRSATLNLVYLPLYLAGIIGPLIGGAVVGAGVPAVFVLAGLVLGGGAITVAFKK